jgi:hypothetical protein
VGILKMAVGEIVSGINTTIATYVYFQPAANVEIMILTAGGKAVANAGLSNGVTDAPLEVADGSHNIGSNLKIGITNTNYLAFYGSTTAPGYSGIQIK